MITVEGKGGIRAAVIADSINDNGNRITTFEVEYPRFIHSEFMTHRLFSRNAASSRAIPVSKMVDVIRQSYARPIHWGKNQPGMQANEELSSLDIAHAKMTWADALECAIEEAEYLNTIGAHKQIVNRLLEPFQMIKVVCTATEYDNFFHLRNHPDAQPEIHELARVMYDAISQSEPELLNPGEWHTPYVAHCCGPDESLGYYVIDADGNDVHLDAETALKVSASCCAQVSYRLTDNSVDKAIDIYNKLVESKPVHASPFEHQATPMEYPTEYDENLSSYIPPCMDGATHTDRYGNNWSGNLKGWIQHRQLIPDNTCWDYKQ